MYRRRELKRSLKSTEHGLRADVYKLEGCKVYWIKFTDLLTGALTVRIISEFKNYTFNEVIGSVRNNLFSEVASSLRHAREKRKASLSA